MFFGLISPIGPIGLISLVSPICPIGPCLIATFGSIIAAYVASFVLLAVNIFDDTVGIFLRNFKVRHSGQQVDVAYADVSTYMLVEKLHQLTRIEAVLFAQVDKQLGIALRGRRSGLLTPAFALLASYLFLLTSDLLNFWCISIVGQELAKLQRDDLLNQVILVNLFEVAADILHKRSYLLLVDVRLHNLVHHLIELLLADFFC